MDYIKQNKEAWEEAFEHRHPGWGEENHLRLGEEQLPFFCHDVKQVLNTMDFQGKTVAQFCCNNGRELLSLLQLGASKGVGFDIADNLIQQARETAVNAGINNCTFVTENILDIDEGYYQYFDFGMFTIGGITWFQDLEALFKKVAHCLRPGGILLIHDFHPFMNMLPMPGEKAFQENHRDRITYSYFRAEPWIENEGMAYMSEEYKSKTFTSFSHTLSDLINGLLSAGLNITKFNEYSYDVGLTDVYDNKGYPLSFLMTAVKS